MKKSKQLICIGLLCAFALLLCGCGPDSDDLKIPNAAETTATFAPDTGAQMEYPFATTRVEAAGTPVVTTVRGWLGEIVTLTRGSYQVLNQGNMGTDVKNLQKRLIELGYMSGTASGTFNEATTLAVRRFESAYGQEQTGIATELMQYYLFSDTVKRYTGVVTVTSMPSYSAGSRTLQIGDSGSDVYQLKTRLCQLGYLRSVSGTSFDSETETAVKAFQAAYGQSMTGIASVELQKYLYSSGAITAYEAQHMTPTPTPAPTSPYKTLRSGDKGTAVTELQNRLRELGYMRAKADGKYGENTVEAVKLFEMAYGKTPTGVATAAMQVYLFADDALPYGMLPSEPTPTPTSAGYVMLAYGSEGEEVIRLQNRLIELGYLNGEADGEYGTKTKQAVSLFETVNGYTATGVATAALQKYLYSGNALYNTQVEPTQTPDLYRELTRGSYGAEVSDLQERLMELGYYFGSINGSYDDDTVIAVMAFETAYGQPATGRATSALQLVLYSSSAKANVAVVGTDRPENSTDYKELRKGDKGDDVKRLQKRLIELGYLSGTADGYYGDGTADAVKAFEAAYGKSKTGVATRELQSYLYSDAAKVNTSSNVAVSYITLEKGDKGEEVTKLQERLIQLGYLSGSPTGTYDSRTVSAVKAYQKQMGLTRNGIASSTMQRTLFTDSAKYNADDQIVEVNRTAVVSADVAYTYASYLDTNASGSMSKGTKVTVLRTRGIWAQISLNGKMMYTLLDELTYQNETEQQKPSYDGAVNVNQPAVITGSNVIVYKTASESGEQWGSFAAGTQVTWLRTNGTWAEIKNSAGKIGYVHTTQLSLYGGSSSGYTVLKNGSTGTAVKQLQTRLKALGYFNGDIGGNFLTKTESAVKLFQSQIGLKPDGIATIGFQEILYSPYAPKYKAYTIPSQASYTDMYQGRKDDAVADLQLYLMSYGYLSGNNCSLGSYDAGTVKAVRALQTAMGLSDTSGLASRELQAFIHTKGAEGLKR